MSQIDYLVVTRDIAIERPSDRVWFHFETYKLREGEWGFNLWRANGHNAGSNVSDPDWSSEELVKDWLEGNIERWDIVKGYGWCITDRAAPAQPTI
jgi:hypothetical protein